MQYFRNWPASIFGGGLTVMYPLKVVILITGYSLHSDLDQLSEMDPSDWDLFCLKMEAESASEILFLV
jgi:hypothetical protein